MEKSPVWKYFTPAESRGHETMRCTICGMQLTAKGGRFLAANLEKHLRTMHADSDAYRSYQSEKEAWLARRPRQSVAHKIPLRIER